MGRFLCRVLGQSRGLVVGGVLAGACGLVAAQAQPNGVTSSVSGLTTRVATPAANGYWIPSVDGSNFRVGTTAAVGAPGGKAANATLSAGVGRTVAARFMATALKALPVVGTGLVLWELFDAVRVRPDGSGGLVFDAGSQPLVTDGYGCSANGQLYTSGGKASAQQACARAEAEFVCSQNREVGEGYTRTCTVLSTVAVGQGHATNFRTAYCSNGGGCATQNFQTTVFIADPMPMPAACPALPDGSVPTVDADGKCPSGAYAPITEDGAAQKLDPVAPGDMLPGFDDALGRAPLPLPSPAEITEVSPNPVPGPTSVTTGPNGTKETETEYVPQPSPGRIDWKERETTTTTDPEGNTTEETTETGGREDEQQDPCETRPNTIGCIELGDPPVDELVLQDRTVTITPMGGWGADNASCPAGQSFTVMGQSYSLSYEPLCQFAGAMRAVVLAGAWIAAAFIVLGMRGGGEDG